MFFLPEDVWVEVDRFAGERLGNTIQCHLGGTPREPFKGTRASIEEGYRKLTSALGIFLYVREGAAAVNIVG